MLIHYICAYADSDLQNHYYVAPSGCAKIGYIKSALIEAGFNISIFSPVLCRLNNFALSKSRVITLNRNEEHHYPFSLGGKSKLIHYISLILVYLQLFYYLMRKVNHSDKVLLYHQNKGTRLIYFFAKMLQLDIYLELEEIYSAAYRDINNIEKEKLLVSHIAKGYIVVNNIISHKCHVDGPYVVCEGQYQSLTSYPKSLIGLNNKINILYAGIIEDDADAFVVIEVAKHLSANYHMHIAGYGTESVVKKFEELICDYKQSNYQCEITYYGCLYGAEYESLLSKCSIGLCSRVLDDNLSDYTFPSKVFAYLARNLKVVCTPISCVLASPISSSIVFSESTSSRALASAIMSINDSNEIDNSTILYEQHRRFVREVKFLFLDN